MLDIKRSSLNENTVSRFKTAKLRGVRGNKDAAMQSGAHF